MKFGNLFELHKIPEWYHDYLDWKGLHTQIQAHRQLTKDGTLDKVSGIWFMTEGKRIIDLPIFDEMPDEIKLSRSE
jgi:hypothetical protein